jgi:hypothetical protein
VLALLFAFGSVYFFTGVQGTVWFAAHVVGVAVGAIYLLAALDAEHAIVSGLMIGFGFLTRTPLLFAAPLFVMEAGRTSLRDVASGENPAGGAIVRALGIVGRIDKRRFARKLVLFAVPIALCIAVALWHNRARSAAPVISAIYLTVVRQEDESGASSATTTPGGISGHLTSLPGTIAGSTTSRSTRTACALDHDAVYLWLLWPKKADLSRRLWPLPRWRRVPGLCSRTRGGCSSATASRTTMPCSFRAPPRINGVRSGSSSPLPRYGPSPSTPFGELSPTP